MNRTCYKPVNGLDDVIASKVIGWNKYLVANLRGLYEEKNPDSTPTAEELIKFRKELSKEDSDRLLDSINNPTISYQQLREEFTAEERVNRINMISTLFSDVVDAYNAENPSTSRKDIISQVTESGIFNEVYAILQEQYSDYSNEGNTEIVKKYQKIFDNWGALISHAKIRLKDIENIRLGQRISFADNSNPNDFNDNNMTEKFIMEESKREGWMNQNEFESSFGSIGEQVRKVISRIPLYKNGKEVLDDLGFPVMRDPVKTHQELLDILRGVNSEEDMINILRKESSDWVQPLLEELEIPKIRTQFYVDFKKNFQPYSIQTEQSEGKIKKYKTVILNRPKGNKLFSELLTVIKTGASFTPNSIYNNSGEIIPDKLERVKNKIVDTLTSPKDNITEKSKFWKMSRPERKLFLIDVTESLGINLDGESIDRLISKNRDINKFNRELLDLANFGLKLTSEESEGKKKVNYIDLINKPSSNEKKGVLKEKLKKLLSVASKYDSDVKLESRVRYKDNTFFSNIIPSFMGDIFDKINNLTDNRDISSLKTMLETTYMDSPYFRYQGKMLNKWIEELYNSDLGDDNSFASNFTYKRFLGGSDLDFENFTSKQQAVQMLNEFFSEKQISTKSEYAWYPVFVLGDSGVSKFIKAKRYNYQEILDGMYNVYIQEKRRMEMAKAVNIKMSELGIKPIDNFSTKADKYTMLPFLNEKKYANMIKEGNLEQTVKNAIASYMRDAVAKFKDQLNTLGVLEESNGQYIYLSQEVKGDATIDKVLANYYWNTKFATIQQLQMFTIDPSFYKDTKDLQKRYKEIHAPGTELSLEAIDPTTNEKFSNDAIERCVYFDDITVNAEDFNSDFMKAIANTFGKDSKVYRAYKENTLTDGQGYRTLESYKKVMGMAGKWDEKMEEAYQQIQSIRARINRDENPTPEDIKNLSDLAVIFQPIKPYLYTFENYSINGEDVLKIPVQHKYAEAVLIPELLPAGSKLRDIAYWMEDHINPDTKVREPIDMIGSTKIVKVGSFGSTDISNINKDNIVKSLNTAYVHQLSYGDYRIQTNVPEHVNSSQLFGTQVKKLIMAKINKFKDYSKYIGGKKVNIGGKYGEVKLTGRNLVRFYNSLISANIVESYHMFEKAILSPSDVSNRLIQVTANNSRESKDNLIAYSLNESNEFTLPLFEGALEHDSSALLLSLFKRMVNKQSIKGGSAVQVSAMGIRGYEEDGDLKYVVDPNNPNNILYAECEIPWDLNYTDNNGVEHSLDFNDWCNEDGTLKVDSDGNILLEQKYPNILSILAYRIPTEKDYSMINLRVKRFSHKMMGGTIKVPPQGTTIAGFDFDIDKLYFMRYEYKQRQLTSKEIEKLWGEFYDTYPNIKSVLKEAREEDTESMDRLYKYWEKAGLPNTYQDAFNQFVEDKGVMEFEEYDFSKSPLDNTRASRNNMLIKLIQERLMDEETFKDRYTPGGFSNASNAAKVMKELIFSNIKVDDANKTINLSEVEANVLSDNYKDPETNHDPSDPMTIIIYNQQNNIAGKLIGIFANQNTNHAFASVMEEFSLKAPVKFAGKSYSDLLHNDNIDTSLTVAELLAASVDAVKDPVLNYLNLNTITADAGAMLARLGFTTEDIGLLFNQPVIKDICEYSFNTGMSDISSVIANVIESYELKDDLGKPVPDVDFSRERLAYNIVKTRDNKDAAMKNSNFVRNQLHIAELFKTILMASNDVSNFVRNTKFSASNAIGSTFGDMYSQQLKVNKYVASFLKDSTLSITMKVSDMTNLPIDNSNSYLNMADQEYLDSIIENPLSYEQSMYDMIRKALEIMNKYYPYNNVIYKSARSILTDLTKSGTLDATTINSIHSDLLVYMLSTRENSIFNSNMPITINGASVNSYAGNITPVDNVIFVFGSNPEGRHGAGAAKVAREQFGAVYGQGEGLQGNSYALPTKDLRVKENKGYRSISKEQIVNNIRSMYRTAIQNPDKKFMVAYRNAINETSLNGYTGGEMIDMFIEAGNIPSNVFFSEEWVSSGKFSTKNQRVTAREYYTNMFPERLFNIIKNNPSLKNLPIFKYMQFQTDDEGKISVNIQDIGGLAPYQKDEIKESWSDLLRNSETKTIAEDLFMYNFYKLGFTFSPMGFMNLAPTELKLNISVGNDYNGDPISYVDFLNDVMNNKIVCDVEEFAKQYLLNHLNNTRLVFHPKGRDRKVINALAFQNNVAVNSFILDANKLKNDANSFLLPSDSKEITRFRPVIVVDDLVYMAKSTDKSFNESSTGAMTYHLVKPLGDAVTSLQYTSDIKSFHSSVDRVSSGQEGNTSVEPEIISPTSKVNISDLIKEAADLAVTVDNTLQRDMILEMLHQVSEQDLVDTIEALRKELDNMKDQQGNKIC